MALTVNSAFSEFQTHLVNLDPDDTRGARASRDWLIKQIDAIPSRRSEFPRLYSDVHIHFGSFARRTKIRELDDLDIIIGISALGTTYAQYDKRVELTVPDGIALRDYCHDGTRLLNSRKVINLFVDYLQEIPQYTKSAIKRNGSAAVLDLASYTWSFDIVPAFFTTPESDTRTYYIIPDHHGHWMKTDPRIDRDRVSSINQRHDGYILNPLRLLRFWNRRPTMPTMPSYLMECMVLDYYEIVLNTASPYVDLELPHLFAYVANAVFYSVNDPKRIQGDINGLSVDERIAIAVRANADAQKAREARSLEDGGKYKESIDKWREVFGDTFPRHG